MTANATKADKTSIGQASSEDWFDELDNLNAILSSMPDEVDQTYKRVRVVVIDTGIDGTDPYAKHVRDYKDFVSKNDGVKQDKTGHGTNSVKLIFKVYAQAEVYVARVFESNHANDDTQDLMLEVRCASNALKSVTNRCPGNTTCKGYLEGRYHHDCIGIRERPRQYAESH